MNELKQHLEKAYGYVSRLQVSGDGVDLAALARLELRLAYGLAAEKTAEGDRET